MLACLLHVHSLSPCHSNVAVVMPTTTMQHDIPDRGTTAPRYDMSLRVAMDVAPQLAGFFRRNIPGSAEQCTSFDVGNAYMYFIQPS